MQTPLDSEGFSPPSAVAYTGARVPVIRISVTPSVSGTIASAYTPFYGGDLLSYLIATNAALLCQQAVIAADLLVAEAAWDSATNDSQKSAAQDMLDKAAARMTYCGQAISESDRSVELATEYEPIGAA
jgi:hypothetical protein